MDIALQLILSAIVLGSVYSLFGVSLNLVWGISGVVNLAHGSFLVMGAYALWQIQELDLPVIIFIPIVLALLSGLFFVTYRLFLFALGEENLEFGGLLVSWGVSLIILATLRATVGTDLRKIQLLSGTVSIGSAQVSLASAVTFLIATAVAAGIALFLKLTNQGRRMRAVGSRPELAGAVGINVPAIRAMAFSIGMTMAVGSGMIFGTGYVFFPNIGDQFIIKAVTIVLVAGLGKLWRTWSVGMLLAIGETLTQYVWSVLISQLLAYSMLVFVLIIRMDDITKFVRRSKVLSSARDLNSLQPGRI